METTFCKHICASENMPEDESPDAVRHDGCDGDSIEPGSLAFRSECRYWIQCAGIGTG